MTLGRYTFATDTSGTATLQQAAYTTTNLENYTSQIRIMASYIELSTYRVGTNGQNATAYNLKEWVDSARINGGYYIGRYEASYASGSSLSDYKAATKASTTYRTQEDGSMQYSQGTLWNWITQPNASQVAINTYKDCSSVKSDLVNSYAWDTAIVFMQTVGNTGYANQDGYSINSSLTDTGTGQDEVCKINDMASNLVEWTTENSVTSGTPCTIRGGYYGNSRNLTNSRFSNGHLEGTGINGFRLTLFIEE